MEDYNVGRPAQQKLIAMGGGSVQQVAPEGTTETTPPTPTLDPELGVEPEVAGICFDEAEAAVRTPMHDRETPPASEALKKAAPAVPGAGQAEGARGLVAPVSDTPPRPHSTSESRLKEEDDEEAGLDLSGAIFGRSSENKKALEVGSSAWWQSWLNKGDLSNVATFSLLVLGLIVRAAVTDDGANSGEKAASGAEVFANFLVSCGLFGFSGGITNWLAVKMLFDKVGVHPYYLWGSGVVPRQFLAIREAVKNMILKMFFDKAFLQKYLNDRAQGMLGKMDLGLKLKSAMGDPSFDALLEQKLVELSAKPEGMLVATMAPMFGGVPAMVPVLKPFLAAFGEELLKVMVEKFDVDELMPIDSVLAEIELLLNEKLKLITPGMVKELLEEVIREHLGWLVVWGNIFGAGIGFVSALFGYGV